MGKRFDLPEVAEIGEKLRGHRVVEEKLLHERSICTDFMANRP
jgi:hypothetical protein